MRASFAFLAALSLLATAAHAQCPVSPGVWTGQVGQQSIVFRITSDGMMVDSVAVSFVDECGRTQYSASDETPVLTLQCSPWGFEWFHCRDQPAPSTHGFLVTVRFDAYAHGLALLDFLNFGCNGGSCVVADMIDVTPVTPSEPPTSAISCQYAGGGTIQYGVSDGGTGVHFEVETASFGAISIDAPPRDLTGPVDTASFPVSCTGAGRGAVTLSVRSGAVLIDARAVCFECTGTGQEPTEASCSVGGPSQTTQWTQTYVGPSFNGPATVRQTADGGYALAGNRDSGLHLIKTDPLGSVEWERLYTVAGRTLRFGDMEPTQDGYILAGYIYTPGPGQDPDFYLLKADAAGDTVWTRTYADSLPEAARAVAQTSDGGYIVVGNVSFAPPRYDDFMLVKTDASGSALWTRIHDAGDLEVPYDVQETSDGGYVLAGYTTGLGAGSSDAYLVKTNAAGIVEWERTFGGIDSDWARSVQQTSDEGFILAGVTRSFGAGPPGDFYLIRTSANGTELWSRTYGGPDLEQADAVRETANGGYLFVGRKTSMGVSTAYSVSTTVIGDLIWTHTVGHTGGDVDVALTSDGGAAVLTTIILPSDSGFLLTKLGPPETTAVTEAPPRATGIALSAFPNPFNPTTRVVFQGAEPAVTWLTIHDVAGRLVRVLARGTRIPGGHEWTFDATGLPSGIYTASLKTDRGDASRKLVLVK